MPLDNFLVQIDQWGFQINLLHKFTHLTWTNYYLKRSQRHLLDAFEKKLYPSHPFVWDCLTQEGPKQVLGNELQNFEKDLKNRQVLFLILEFFRNCYNSAIYGAILLKFEDNVLCTHAYVNFFFWTSTMLFRWPCIPSKFSKTDARIT